MESMLGCRVEGNWLMPITSSSLPFPEAALAVSEVAVPSAAARIIVSASRWRIVTSLIGPIPQPAALHSAYGRAVQL